MRCLILFAGLLLLTIEQSAIALDNSNLFYVGAQAGYGNTDWSRLVSQDDLSSTATPLTATGDGAAYGVFAGYQITPRIALEADYMHFPDADLTFAVPNLYGISSMTSKTGYVSLISKLFVLTNSDFRIFGDIGWSRTFRSDEMANISNSSVTFGFGADYSISEHWFGIFAFEYTPGTAVAAHDASAQYVPYVYSLTLGLAYRF